MADWDHAQYLKFEKERTQPSIDLARRIDVENPQKILDVGCGPGNSTAVLARQFPGTEILGVDSSPDMIAAAQKAYPDLCFALCDISSQLDTLPSDYDIIFSNACLQWVPDHKQLIPQLFNHLTPGGVMAVQIPFNSTEPIHRIIKEVSSSDAWRGKCAQSRVFYTLSRGDYYDILSALSKDIALWQTTYLHVMDSPEAMLDWYRGTGLRPYLNALSSEDRPLFEADILREIRIAYPAQADGKALFPFPRLFFTAKKGM